MRLDELIRDIKDTSLRHTLVNEFGEGDIYEYLNSGEHKYPCVFLTVTGLGEVGYMREVNITLFYVDRLTSDQRNRTSIQSEATDVLGDIIHSFESNNVNYTLFTEKFSDLCAGAYAEFTVSIEYSAGCEQNFIIRTKKIEDNGLYNVEDYEQVEVDVKGCNEEIVEYYENQIGSLTNQVEVLEIDLVAKDEEIITLTEEKEVLTNQNITLNSELRSAIQQVDNLTEENENKQAYIDTVTSKTITENGTYTPEEGVLGWNNINVNVTSTSEVWKVPDGTKFYNSSWSSAPALDFSNVTNFGSMFYGCTNLTSIPQMDTSKGTNFNYMFYGCSELTAIPQLDTSNGTSFSSMFYGCTNLISVPELNTSKGTDLNYLFNKCTNLTTVSTLLDFSEISQLHYLFGECTNLTTVSTPLDFSELTYINGAFYKCDNLTNITFVGSINCSIDFSYCKLLSYESVKSILTACSNTNRPTTSKTLKFNRTLTDQNGELVALIADCTSKKWTISGLTLQ